MGFLYMPLAISALSKAKSIITTFFAASTDQGSQFTGGDFAGVLLEAGIQISMDGRGRWMDNVFIERLWRSLKHEDIYLKHQGRHFCVGRLLQHEALM